MIPKILLEIRDKLEKDGFPPVEVTPTLIIRKELLQALFKLWDVDNIDDMYSAMAKYNMTHWEGSFIERKPDDQA